MPNSASPSRAHVPPERDTDVFLTLDAELDDKIETVARWTQQEKADVIRESLERGLDTLIARSART